MKIIEEHDSPSKSPQGTTGRNAGEFASVDIASQQTPPPTNGEIRSRASRAMNMSGSSAAGLSRKEQRQRIATGGEVLGDGSFVELIRDGAQELLLRWSTAESSIAAEVACGDWWYVPTDAASLIHHLPSEPVAYGSTETLFAAMTAFIEKSSGVDSEDAELLAFVGLASYFCDCLSMSPCLLLFGAPLQAVSLLRVLGCVCRHPILSAGSSVGGLPPELRPTRLICQTDSRVDRQLAALQFSGFGIIDPQPRQISGASVIYAGDAELKTPFAEVCLQLRLSPGNRPFGIQDEDQQSATATQLQNQLLMYRLQNYSKVKACQFDVPEFCGPARECARTLGRCIVDAPDLQSRLTALLRSQDEAERTESASKLDAVVVEALAVCCHERKPSVHVGEVAALANGILSRGGEVVELSDKQVGGRMKRLGFRTTRLDAGGRGIYLLNGACARIHKLGRAFEVPTVRQDLPGCPYCQQGT